jgi:GntR family transcriptional regulator of arabinose operon
MANATAAQDDAGSSAKTQPKYHKIVESLKKGLAAGLYRNGVRLPSEAELSRTFNVSRMTVVKAVQQLQQEGLVVRKVGSGTYAAPANEIESLVFGLLIPDLGQTEIFEPICRGMVRSPQAKKHSLLWGHSMAAADNKEDQARELCQHYLAQNVNGVFFAPLEFSPRREAVNSEILKKFRQAKVPVVLLDRCGMPFPQAPDLDLVGLDNRRAGFLLTEHLLTMGAKKIAFFARAGSAETVQARIAGCREALSIAGLSLAESISFRDGELEEAATKQLGQVHAIDAVVCANDQTAAKLMKAVLSHGIKVPGQLRVVGFDDVTYGSLLEVPLTTIHQPCADIGASAMAAMLDRIDNPALPPRSILLNGHLIVRQSCGALNPAT